MPKYTGKTYSRNRKKECQSSSQFDDVLNDAEESSSKTTTSVPLPKKTAWSRINKAVEKTKEQSPKKKDASNVSRNPKLDVIDEHDPFAFTDEEEVILPNSQGSNAISSAGSSSQSQLFTDPSDKSTDDEAYSSSQELSESSSKSGFHSRRKTKPSSSSSPFKSFLKNNDKSLSPVKAKNMKRLSALPTSMDFSEEDSQEDSAPEVPPPVLRCSSWPQRNNPVVEGAIKVRRVDKPLFTVVRNVKKVSECLESGEDQEFFDDVEYLLDGLQANKLATRCLSALDVASRCMSGSFRVNLRAHGVIPRIFKLLNDAHEDKNLALCTSAIMYVLTQDKQHIDLDKFVLEMMMKFLSVEKPNEDESTVDKDYNKYVTKTRSVLEERNNRIPGVYLELDNISASSLARESLLSITTERMGAWFKEEIRLLGGLDHIVNAVSECVNWLLMEHGNSIQRDKDSQAKIKRIDKSLKLLENITYQNAANQNYLLHYQEGALARELSSYTRLCVNTISDGLGGSTEDHLSAETTVDDSLFDTLKVFLNLSNDCEEGSVVIGQQDGLLSSLLFCVLQLPQFCEASKRFDLHVLGLGLLINLVEHSKQNIAILVQLQTEPFHESQNTSCDSVESSGQLSSTEALMQLFLVRERAARDTDQMTSGLSTEDESEEDQALVLTKDGLGWVCGNDIDVTVVEEKGTTASSSSELTPTKENLEDEIGKALVIAGKHMEDSMVASYVALLLGCIVQDNQANEALVKSLLPDGDFSLLVDVLKKFLGFMRLTSGTSGHAIEKILKVVENCLVVEKSLEQKQ